MHEKQIRFGLMSGVILWRHLFNFNVGEVLANFEDFKVQENHTVAGEIHGDNFTTGGCKLGIG